MTCHFKTDLEKNNIETIAEKCGFGNPSYVEKFIMDFEMNYHISQKIDCSLRGGMCMPFHSELDVRRLSIDVDLLTCLKVSEIDDVMKTLDGTLSHVKIKKHKPKNPYPIPNLASYYVEYASCFKKSETVKIDYLCDFSLDLPTKEISSKQDVIEFKIDYPAKILTRGALIGDKITTLSLGKIGLKESKFSDIPKQVYDLATLLKFSSENDLVESFDVFYSFTNFKVKIFEKGVYKIGDIIDGINSSIRDFFSFQSTITIRDEYDGRFGSFTGTYLNNEKQYKKTEHISDLLLVWYYGLFLKKIDKGEFSQKESASQIFSIVKTHNQIRDYSADEKRDTRADLLNNLPELPFNKKVLNGSPVEHVYVIKQIFSN